MRGGIYGGQKKRLTTGHKNNIGEIVLYCKLFIASSTCPQTITKI